MWRDIRRGAEITSMMISDLLSEATVQIDFNDLDKWSTIDRLTDLLIKTGKVIDPDAVRKAILDREQQGSTGLDSGIAIPHARTQGVSDVVAALGISKKGLDFQSPSGSPCHMVFLILAPPNQSTKYLESLAAIASFGRHPEGVSRMCSVNAANEVISLFKSLTIRKLV